MPYWQLYYHIVWDTKNREPLLTPEVEPIIYGFLRNKAMDLRATVFALGGVEDHVHMVVSIPPTVLLSKFVGQVKAVASTKYNKSTFAGAPFFWQQEYGIFSFDAKRLPNFTAYANNQKQHHAQRTAIPVLERWSEPDGRRMAEGQEGYCVEDPEWREELMAPDAEPL